MQHALCLSPTNRVNTIIGNWVAPHIRCGLRMQVLCYDLL